MWGMGGSPWRRAKLGELQYAPSAILRMTFPMCRLSFSSSIVGEGDLAASSNVRGALPEPTALPEHLRGEWGVLGGGGKLVRNIITGQQRGLAPQARAAFAWAAPNAMCVLRQSFGPALFLAILHNARKQYPNNAVWIKPVTSTELPSCDAPHPPPNSHHSEP